MAQLWALVIGIDQYQSGEVSSLGGCVKDAESLRDLLLRYCKDAQVCLLSDAAATRAAIIGRFQEHLIDNPRITRNDPIVVYFAGKGRRITDAPDAPGMDLLVPYDYCEEVPGISATHFNSLLCDLAYKKGRNITFILDSSFSSLASRGKVGHRSETSPVPALRISRELDGPSPQYKGFFSGPAAPYVLLAACQQNELAYESSDGGAFTQALIRAMRQDNTMTYRELTTGLSVGLESDKQHPVCSGMHADRVLFSIPSESPVQKLRVFLDSAAIELEIDQDHDFVQVGDKTDANVALRTAPDGRTIIDRLDGPIAAYASRELLVPAKDSDSLSFVLNKIAHFTHYLALEPPPTSSSWLRRFWRWNTGPRIKLYRFRCSPDGTILGPKSRNLLRKGVACLHSVPADCYFGLEITNRSNRAMYPYLLCFDPATYTVQAGPLVSEYGCLLISRPQTLLTPSPSETSLPPLKPRRLFSTSFFTVGFGEDGGLPMTFPVDDIQGEKDAAVFKVILCQKPVDLGYMLQQYPLTSSLPSLSASERAGPQTIISIPGTWGTATAIVSIYTRPRPTSWLERVVQILGLESMLLR